MGSLKLSTYSKLGQYINAHFKIQEHCSFLQSKLSKYVYLACNFAFSTQELESPDSGELLFQ